MLVTVVAQFSSKTINSEKALYFLSLMSCSMNKLKSHMLFTCKNCMFCNITREKKFAQGNSRGAGAPHHNPTVVIGFCFTLNTSEISAKKLGKINS